MASGKEMPKIDIAKELPNLSAADQHFIKKVETMNRSRAESIIGLRKRNRLVGGFLAASVLAIYGYSIYKVSQEKFLDFDEVPDRKKPQ